MEQLIYDYVKYGKEARRFILPPRIKVEPEFAKDLKEIAIGKLEELIERKRFLEKSWDNRSAFLDKSPETKKKLWFQIYFESYCYNLEVGYIDKWIKYWKNFLPRKRVSAKENKDSFTEEQIQQAREYPLEELIGGDFKRAGLNKIRTCCPFHEERTPSFFVYTDKNSAHCFGCQKHFQNAIDYAMEVEKLEFAEAVRRLL